MGDHMELIQTGYQGWLFVRHANSSAEGKESSVGKEAMEGVRIWVRGSRREVDHMELIQTGHQGWWFVRLANSSAERK